MKKSGEIGVKESERGIVIFVGLVLRIEAIRCCGDVLHLHRSSNFVSVLFEFLD